jgi:hypothetical protein
MEAIGQDPDFGGVGIGRRIGRRILGAGEDVALDHAEQRAVSQMQAKPAYNRARRLASDAESDRDLLLDRYQQACRDLVLGLGGEAEVEDAEAALEAVEREHRRMTAAAVLLAEEAGFIFDSSGVKLSR